MKRLFLLLTVALVALVSCKKEGDNSSLEGRWNVYREANDDSDYTYSLIFKGNKLDVYIIAWGEHVEGTYTYANGKITYNISKVHKAWAEVYETEPNDKTLTISGSWDAYQGMNKETFELASIYSWYLLSKNSSHYPDMLQEIDFKLTSATTAETSLMGGTAYKAK